MSLKDNLVFDYKIAFNKYKLTSTDIYRVVESLKGEVTFCYFLKSAFVFVKVYNTPLNEEMLNKLRKFSKISRLF